jgi:hypothetical protein
MLEEKKGMCEDKNECFHGQHMCKHMIVKKIMFIIILVAVFCFGIQLGELRTLTRLVYGSNSFMGQSFNRATLNAGW